MYKVILVDDEILVREAIQAKIPWKELGYDLVQVCENGRDAIEYLKSHAVDLVLTDICMPYADGIELSRFVNEELPDTFVVIISGYSDFEYAKLAIKYGVGDYVLKPVTAKELSQVLSEVREKLGEQRKYSKAFRDYTKNEAVIISKTLANLVRGSEPAANCLQALKELSIEIEGDLFCVMLITMDDYSGHGSEKIRKTDGEIMAFSVENVAAETLNDWRCAITYRDREDTIGVLLCARRGEDFLQKRKRACHDIRQNISEVLHITVSIFAGVETDSVETLFSSYDLARKATDYRFTKGSGLLYDASEHPEEETLDEIDQYTEKLATGIKEKNIDVAEQVLNEIDHTCKKRWIGKGQSMALLHRLMLAVKETEKEASDFIGEDAQEEQGQTYPKEMENAGSFTEAMGVLKCRVEFAMQNLQAINKSSAEQQAEKAEAYMRENYGNPDLTLGHICRYMNVSTSYFSTIMKEVKGVTFTELLLSIRMEKAKELLANTKLKNYEVAEKVGFSDPHYFSIVFKKMTGKTPKEFAKEQCR